MSKKKYNLQINDIQNRLNNGETVLKIASKFGCHTSNIYQFIKKYNIVLPKIDLVGKEFGEYKVISYHSSNLIVKYWLCKCSCGNIKKLSTQIINANKTKSCGCLRKRNKHKHKNWKGYKDIHGKWWSNIKKGAIYRKHKFNITIQYAWKLFIQQNRKCALTGLDIKFGNTMREIERGATTASLDRIDNNKGYVKDNIHWVHKDINLMKQKFSLKQFKEYCKLVTKKENKVFS